MSLKDAFHRASQDIPEHIMKTYDEDGLTRPDELAETERKLHRGFTSWTNEHKIRFPKMGRLPYRPDLFPDQRIDRPYRPITYPARLMAKAERSDRKTTKLLKPAIYLGELAYLSSLKKAHARTLGSKALSETMIMGFLETPAFGQEYDSPSIADYVFQSLEDNKTVGVTSAHLGALADIAEINGALSIGVAELYGFKYIDRFNTLINSNMTRQTYKVGKIPVPVSWLVRTGLGTYWGVPPGESAEKHGLDDESVQQANKQFLESFRKHKSEHGQVLAYVNSGSGAVHYNNSQTGELEKVGLKDPSYTSTLTRWCEGGIIAVNKFNEQVIFGSVIPNVRPEGVSKKEYSKILTDQVMHEHALQARELVRVPVQFVRLHPEKHLERID